MIRTIDIFLRVLIVGVFLGFFVLPDRVQLVLVLSSFLLTGVCALLFPVVIIRWAKTAHPQLDENDESIWWVSRPIGVSFLLLSGALLISALARS
jgi:hypothetical protein